MALVVGAAWTLGVAELVGLHLNLANFFAVPVLFGLGVFFVPGGRRSFFYPQMDADYADGGSRPLASQSIEAPHLPRLCSS